MIWCSTIHLSMYTDFPLRCSVVILYLCWLLSSVLFWTSIGCRYEATQVCWISYTYLHTSIRIHVASGASQPTVLCATHYLLVMILMNKRMDFTCHIHTAYLECPSQHSASWHYMTKDNRRDSDAKTTRDTMTITTCGFFRTRLELPCRRVSCTDSF
jgi:hypothetical protein